MKKRFLAACLALVAFAAFAPAASASPVLKEGGIPIAAGATVTAQSEGTYYRTTSSANISCSGSHMHGTVVKNSSAQIEIEFTAVTGCWGAANVPWCLRANSETVDSFTLKGGKCGEAPKSITTTGLNHPACAYVSLEAFTGTYSTGTLGAGLTTEVERFNAEAGLFCPPFDIDPIKYNLSTAASPFTKLTIS